MPNPIVSKSLTRPAAPRVIVWPVTAMVLGIVGLVALIVIWAVLAEWWEDRKKRPLVVGFVLLVFGVAGGLAWSYVLRPLVATVRVENPIVTLSIISLIGVVGFALYYLERWQARRELRFLSQFEEQVRESARLGWQESIAGEREQQWWMQTRAVREQRALTHWRFPLRMPLAWRWVQRLKRREKSTSKSET